MIFLYVTKMKVFAVLLLCILAVSAEKKFTTLKDLSSKGVDTRIVNGNLAEKGQFPWQVAVNFLVGGSWYFCGGALISSEWVLTAAHCADEATYFNMTLGSININGEVAVESKTAHVHPDYNSWLNNDIALVKLSKAVNFTDTIQPIDLVTAGNELGVEDKVRVSGWGKTSDSAPGVTTELRYVDLKTISNKDCKEIYGDTVQNNTVCCNASWPPKTTCNGDSGGPVIQYFEGRARHVAIVSFVHAYGCESGNPSGYIRTEAMLDWIYSTTGLSRTV